MGGKSKGIWIDNLQIWKSIMEFFRNNYQIVEKLIKHFVLFNIINIYLTQSIRRKQLCTNKLNHRLDKH
jgi:hypothetical protein